MTLPVISVIIPTVTGREDYYKRCSEAYIKYAPGHYELDLVTALDEPSCGAGWHAGAERSAGDYLHFTCDDIEPLAGWAAPAVEAVDKGFLPAPQVFGPDGQPQSLPFVGLVGADWQKVKMTALPFVSREQYNRISPLLTTHYFSDDWFSARGEWFGIESRLRAGYAFRHWWAQVRRGAGFATDSERMAHDQVLFNQALQMVRDGEWTQAWPPNGGRP